jgi:hypothetical protein
VRGAWAFPQHRVLSLQPDSRVVARWEVAGDALKIVMHDVDKEDKETA